jgi:hypothetical protein
MTQNSHLIKTKDRGAGEGWTREQGFLFCFSQFLSYRKLGKFFQKNSKITGIYTNASFPPKFPLFKVQKTTVCQRKKHWWELSSVWFFGQIQSY